MLSCARPTLVMKFSPQTAAASHGASPRRWISVVFVAFTTGCVAQTSTLPATPPTSSATAPLAATPANTLPHHRARVSYVNGLLDVRADNSSLNQILRDISHATGMTVTGGVADERVFGNYGPSDPATVLQTLLDGSGSDMFLLEKADHAPAKLLLTPRTGGASLPSPGSATFDATENEPYTPTSGEPQSAAAPQRTMPVAAAQTPSALPASDTPGLSSVPQPTNNVNGSENNVSPTASTLPVTDSVPVSTLPTPSTTPSATGIVDAPNPPPPGSTTSEINSQTPQTNPNLPASTGTSNPNPTVSPNGVKTPQQIYQELRELQQKQAGAGQNPPSGQPQ
jgi:hypothetical protein